MAIAAGARMDPDSPATTLLDSDSDSVQSRSPPLRTRPCTWRATDLDNYFPSLRRATPAAVAMGATKMQTLLQQ